MNQFCEHQIKCKEDTDSTFTCVAHIYEGRAFVCPYKSFDDAKSRTYPCIDAKEVKQ